MHLVFRVRNFSLSFDSEFVFVSSRFGSVSVASFSFPYFLEHSSGHMFHIGRVTQPPPNLARGPTPAVNTVCRVIRGARPGEGEGAVQLPTFTPLSPSCACRVMKRVHGEESATEGHTGSHRAALGSMQELRARGRRHLKHKIFLKM